MFLRIISHRVQHRLITHDIISRSCLSAPGCTLHQAMRTDTISLELLEISTTSLNFSKWFMSPTNLAGCACNFRVECQRLAVFIPSTSMSTASADERGLCMYIHLLWSSILSIHSHLMINFPHLERRLSTKLGPLTLLITENDLSKGHTSTLALYLRTLWPHRLTWCRNTGCIWTHSYRSLCTLEHTMKDRFSQTLEMLIHPDLYVVVLLQGRAGGSISSPFVGSFFLPCLYTRYSRCLSGVHIIPTTYHQNQNNPSMRPIFSWFTL